MYLEKLEIQGFKSFANKNLLVFPGLVEGGRRGLTAVVGPNGSGKSNIADAVRWALGEQSMKMLRGKKSEDIIFSGSDKKNKLGMAEVSLYFNNEDRQAPVEFNHFILTRRLYRDGESEYLINNSRVRLLDVQLMLAKANVGQKTYSVIGQGMVEGFLNTSLSERKEFFDEATGVKQFQIKRDDSLNKLRASLEHLGQAEMLLGEIEPRLGNLTRQVNKLKKRGELEAELRELQLSYFRTIWHEINDRFKTANESLLELEKTKQTKDKKLASLMSELSALQGKAGASQEFNRLQEELSVLQSKREKLQTELIKIEARLEIKGESAHGLSKEVALELQNKIKKSLQLLEKAELLDDTKGIKAALAEIKKELSELHSLAGGTAAKKIEQSGSGEQSTLKKELGKIDEEISAHKNKLSRFTDEQEAERQRLFSLQNNSQTLQHEVNQLNNQLNDTKVEAARQETKLEDLENAIRADLGGLKEVRDARENNSIDRFAVQEKISQLKRQLELIGGIDPEIEQEYITTKERHDFLSSQVNDLLTTGQSLENIIEELDATIKERFDKEFKIIAQKFEEYFKILFNGGNAKIIKVMVDETGAAEGTTEGKTSEEETSEGEIQMTPSMVKLKRIKHLQKYNATGLAGIEIQATPPGKKIKSIAMLSGGERALTAIALISAIISANPSPFVMLDEVDAALDEANSERLAKILDDLSHKTQFIVITHNRASMMRAVMLYGVTMQDDGASKLLSIKMEDAKFNR